MSGMRLSSAAAVALQVLSTTAAAEKLPVEVFARDFGYETMQISPDGTRLAVTHLRDGSNNLAVIDIGLTQGAALSGFKEPDSLEWFGWKSNDSLVYLALRHDEYSNHIPVLTSARSDGKKILNLNYNPQPNGRYTFDRLLDWLPEDPDSVLIVSDADKQDYPTVYRTDIQRPAGRSGIPGGSQAEWPTAREQLFVAPGRECTYMTDNKGVVRTCVTHEIDNARRFLYRDGNGGKWTELARFEPGDGGISPLGFTPDNARLYVLSNVNRDTRALFLYDPEKKALGEMLFEAEGVDLAEPIYASDGRRLVAVTFYQQSMGIFYLDEQLQEIHIGINQAFRGRQAQLVSFSNDNRKIIVWVGTPWTPGSYYLFDAEKRGLSKVVDVAPWIDPEKMGTVRSVDFKARDGLPLEGYLTLPRGKPARNLPLIVNVHGGPHGVRDVAEFDRESQFFANRGYAVLQINYRGSGGYGREFRSAGVREWGRRMQTDVVDGVEWLVGEGIVDRERVGIFGGSYGGYAAMMAVITAPELFKCAVTYAGVSNLVRMLNAKTMVASSGLMRRVGRDERRYWESVIGDRKDEEALKEISPVYNVDKIRVPVFIAHGGEDLTVPVVEATDLHKALRKAEKTVDLLVLPKEGHGFFQEKSRAEFYQRLDAFFEKHLPAG